MLFRWAAAEQIPWQWHNQPISPDGFARTLSDSHFQQAVVLSRDSAAIIGHLALYAPDFQNQRV